MSAGTVVIAGGILAAVILLTIVAVLCLCRLQYYCCRREESEKAEEEMEVEEPELSNMSPSQPLALCGPLSPPSPQHYGDNPGTYPPTFLTEANGPMSWSPTPPPRGCQRSYNICPSCARCTIPYYFQHPDGLCNGGRGINYRSVQNQDPEPPMDWASFHQKLNLIRSVTTNSISTDV